MQLLTTNTAYLVVFRGHRKLITICGKFAVVSCGNLANWPAEFGKICRRKLWSLYINAIAFKLLVVIIAVDNVVVYQVDGAAES